METGTKKAAELLVAQAQVLQRTGAHAEAIRLCKAALELDPDNPDAKQCLKLASRATDNDEPKTERIDATALRAMLNRCATAGRPADGKAPDAFDPPTLPVIPEELVEKAAQSWVDSPEDDLEITIDERQLPERPAAPDAAPPDATPPAAPANLLDKIIHGTVALDEWRESEASQSGDDDLVITVDLDEPNEKASSGTPAPGRKKNR